MSRPPVPGRPSLLDRFAVALAALICLPALAPTLMPGWFEGHDDLHIYRLIEYDLALRDGQLPPRWFPDVSAGYGNPHPIYYAPLFYGVAEAFHLAGLDEIASLKGSIVVFTILASVFMFLFARLFWGTAGALVAAAAYTYAPYHLLDLYVRKAFSEYTVFALLPALLLAFHNLWLRGSRRDIIAGAGAMAAMSTAHTITTMMVPPLLAAYAVTLSVRGTTRRGWRWMTPAACSALIGYALAGFFVVPAYLERHSINLKMYTEAYVDYHKHFVYPQQLVWWPWGFGMSLEGLKDQMSFRMGLSLLAATALAAAGLQRVRRRQPLAAAHVVFFLGVTGVAVFMMIPASAFVWDLTPPLKFVQFPWRFLTLTTLSTAFLAGAALAAWAGPSPRPRGGAIGSMRPAWGLAGATITVFVLEAVAGGSLGVHLRVPADRVGFEEKPYNNMVDRGAGAAAETMDGDFVRRHTLRWIDHLPPGVSFMGLDQTDLDRPKVEVVSGQATVRDVVTRTAGVRFTVDAASPARLRVNVYRFPGWVARVDGVVAPLVDVPRQRRVLFFDVAPGQHDVGVSFERTAARRLGDGLTLAGLGTLAAIGLWPQRRRA